MTKNENVKKWNGVPSDDAELKELKAAVESTYDMFDTIENAKADIKDIFEDIHARTGIPKKIFNFLAKCNYKGDGHEQIAQNDELTSVFDSLQRVDI